MNESGPSLLSRLTNLERRLAHLEANPVSGGTGSGVDADKLDGKHATEIAALVAYGSSTTDYSCAANPSAMETDTTLTVSITPAVTSTLLVWILGNFTSNTARQGSLKARAILDDTTIAGTTENFSMPVLNMNSNLMVLAQYTGVTAAAHTLKLQVQRVNTADTVMVLNRYILVIAIPE